MIDPYVTFEVMKMAARVYYILCCAEITGR